MRCALVIVAALASSPALAGEALEIGASLGYAAPVGSAEGGSRVSDTTVGQFPLALHGRYRLTELMALLARVQYGVGIATKCASASECWSSLGSDVVLTLGARFFLPRIVADASLGYEWLTTRLSDGGATATRAYHGPVVLSLEVAMPFALGTRWTLGPAIGATVGTFTSYALETNAVSPSGSVPDRTWHAWLTVGARLGVAF